jgi:hypothetical protein
MSRDTRTKNTRNRLIRRFIGAWNIAKETREANSDRSASD